MKASELINQLSTAISKHGDIPVVIYCQHLGEHLEISYTNDVEETYQGEDMEMYKSMVVEMVI